MSIVKLDLFDPFIIFVQGEAPPELDAATSARVARLLPSMVGRALEWGLGLTCGLCVGGRYV